MWWSVINWAEPENSIKVKIFLSGFNLEESPVIDTKTLIDAHSILHVSAVDISCIHIKDCLLVIGNCLRRIRLSSIIILTTAIFTFGRGCYRWACASVIQELAIRVIPLQWCSDEQWTIVLKIDKVSQVYREIIRIYLFLYDFWFLFELSDELI